VRHRKFGWHRAKRFGWESDNTATLLYVEIGLAARASLIRIAHFCKCPAQFKAYFIQ